MDLFIFVYISMIFDIVIGVGLIYLASYGKCNAFIRLGVTAVAFGSLLQGVESSSIILDFTFYNEHVFLIRNSGIYLIGFGLFYRMLEDASKDSEG